MAQVGAGDPQEFHSLSDSGSVSSFEDAPVSERAVFEPLIKEFYARHKPEKVEKIDSMMNKYAGNERTFYESLCGKYNVQPVQVPPPGKKKKKKDKKDQKKSDKAAASTVAETNLRFLKEVYHQFLPEQKGNIATLLERHKGREEQFFSMLCNKHGLGDFSKHKNPAELYKVRTEQEYMIHNPDQDCDALFKKYAGQERLLYISVCKKYGVAALPVYGDEEMSKYLSGGKGDGANASGNPQTGDGDDSASSSSDGGTSVTQTKKSKKKKKKERKKSRKRERERINVPMPEDYAAAKVPLGAGLPAFGAGSAVHVIAGQSNVNQNHPQAGAWGAKMPVQKAEHSNVLGQAPPMFSSNKQMRLARADMLLQQFLGQNISVAPTGHLHQPDLDCLKLAFNETITSQYVQACKFISVPKNVSPLTGLHSERSAGDFRESEYVLIRMDRAPKLFKLWREYLKEEGPVVPFQQMEDAFNSEEHNLLRVALFLDLGAVDVGYYGGTEFDSFPHYCKMYNTYLAEHGIISDHGHKNFYLAEKTSNTPAGDRVFSLVRAEENISTQASSLETLKDAIAIAAEECDHVRGAAQGFRCPWSTDDPDNKGVVECVFRGQCEYLLENRDDSRIFHIRDEIFEAIDNNPATLICGQSEPGYAMQVAVLLADYLLEKIHLIINKIKFVFIN